ncbi:MAG TPA: protein kinase [Gemmata sp.]
MRTPASSGPPAPTVPLLITREEAPGDTPETKRQPVDAPPLPALLGGYPRVRGYDIISVVGTGGMGIVYEARHRELNRRVAIKTLRGEALANLEFRERFRAEAEAIARLQHPNVIQVFEVGTVEPGPGELCPSPFIALEFVGGGSLAAHARAPQVPAFAARTVATLARAAHAAHRLGVIHRDLKPSNVLLDRDGHPKIADFGIAKQIEASGSGPLPLTRAGIVMGTPEYMAPEQLDGDTASASIDIYALGVILYELLTGRVPFQGATFAETMRLTLHQEPVAPHRLQPGVPRDLETICLKCLEKSPRKRYATAEELADDLTRWLNGHPILARPLGPVGRGARWARRNPAVALLSVAVVLGTVAGFVGLMWGWDEARWSEKQSKALMQIAQNSAARAEANKERAEAEADKNQAAAEKERWERYRVSLMAASGGLRLHDVLTARRALDEAPREYRDWVWDLLAAQLDRSEWVIGGPTARIPKAQYSANGRWLLDMSPDRDMCVWDLANRTNCGPLVGHRPPTDALITDDGGTVVYPVPEKGELVTIDVPTGAVRTLRGHAAGGIDIQLAGTDRELVSAGDDRTVRVWELATGREVHRFRAPDGARVPFVLSPDGNVVGSRWDDTVPPSFWEVRTGKPIRTFDAPTKPTFGYRFSPDGARVVANGVYPDTQMRLLDVRTGELIATLGGHDNDVSATAFSPDGTRLASCSMDRTVRVWDVSPGGAVKREPLSVMEGHTGWVQRVRFSPDGSRILSTAQDRTLRYWNVKTGKLVAVLRGHSDALHHGTFFTDPGTGEAYIVSHAVDESVRLWSVRAAENDYALRGHGSYVYSANFFPDGSRIASSAWDDTARVWDARTDKELLRLPHGGLGIVTSVAVHPNGRLIATLARKHWDPHAGGGVRLWDADTGALLQTWAFPNCDYRDSRLTFSPDGKRLAAGSPDGRVYLWDMTARRGAAVLEGHPGQVRDVAFSPDGKLLASCGHFAGGAVWVWDVATGKRLATSNGNGAFAYGVAWHPNGKLIATGSVDGSVRLWNPTTGEQLGELKHGSDVYSVAFSPDGKLLATGAADNLIRLWHVGTQREVAELSGHKMYVYSVAFDRNGTRLLSASGDKTVRVWDTDPQRAKATQTGGASH